ncbi:MAG: pseudouridine-5'-phosphate glycosidase [Candidatus Cloacimonetes bacterium]|nr:pseudouridine-5'-phosphate glycosidase [Candidatus Cloacimonadota bacterium]
MSQEVEEALSTGKPVLALESTIISHGLPYPANLEMALAMEDLIRRKNVKPATIAIIRGEIRIGVNREELEFLARDRNIRKISIRDIAWAAAAGASGATTVAATMHLACLSGINVFATGGIGGVHRSGESTFDISTDLIQLSRTPVIVVSAGAKAILDLPRTLEVLETVGVPVLGFQTDDFPAFYSRRSGNKIQQIDEVNEIVRMYRINRRLKLKAGILVANPIPQPDQIEESIITNYIRQAEVEAREQKIRGARLTPFLLQRINELSAGRALQANLKLVENNVRLGCEIAGRLPWETE